MDEKKFNLVIGVAALGLILLQSAGILSFTALAVILAVFWVFLTARIVVKYLKEGQTLMAVSAGIIGIGMIALLVWRLM
ncbi:MAG: hypothetical protein IJ130_13445 [Solobacterium sp.]|nr:hypothetical protein [Solobacterium sp.]